MSAFPLTGVEILYPITPTQVSARDLHQVDDKQYKYVVKSCGDKILSTLKFRIQDIYMSGVLSFFKTNLGVAVDLNTPSVYPFGNNYTLSSVYMLLHSKPQLEKAQFWRLDVTFIQIAGVS